MSFWISTSVDQTRPALLDLHLCQFDVTPAGLYLGFYSLAMHQHERPFATPSVSSLSFAFGFTPNGDNDLGRALMDSFLPKQHEDMRRS